MDKLLSEQVAAFEREIGDLLLRIQTKRRFDNDAGRQVEGLARTLAVLLKPHPMLPKSVLNEFRTAVRVLRNEARTFPNPRKLSDLAETLEVIFDLILMGETPDDRTPGVPRIV